MSPKQEKEPINLVEIDSSDDEDDVGVQVQTVAVNPPSASGNQTLESRSFWKAGDFNIGPTKFTPAQGQLEHARVHPKFLHSNATSHKWAFGAIAELLDNAVDEICNGATFVKVDRIYNVKDNSPALLFQDDGGGMDTEGIRKCMSLGYSSKKANTTIGQYQLAGLSGKKVSLVTNITVLRPDLSAMALEQSVDFDISNHWAEPIIYGSQDDWSTNLETILEWSPFASKDELMLQFEDIGAHGTKVIIFNLWLNDEGIFELNFDGDEEDIMLRDEANRGSLSKTHKKVLELQSHISHRIRYSLRAYVSILYLRKFTNFRIILRGKPVEQHNIGDELKYPKVVIYRPQLAATSKESMRFKKDEEAVNHIFWQCAEPRLPRMQIFGTKSGYGNCHPPTLNPSLNPYPNPNQIPYIPSPSPRPPSSSASSIPSHTQPLPTLASHYPVSGAPRRPSPVTGDPPATPSLTVRPLSAPPSPHPVTVGRTQPLPTLASHYPASGDPLRPSPVTGDPPATHS
ncbi:hypothetical protein RHGRI_030593 [Rhododendron griersonianum]|uniref:Morc S5 domain-containing protein n=1 Tax=Rhododendron griersonianum TaxID=479676 RepID=A0AAV6IS19_9ERIC|nr:hypothetical protein RHGRI_030593 [Rhododendron griersonianum]